MPRIPGQIDSNFVKACYGKIWMYTDFYFNFPFPSLKELSQVVSALWLEDGSQLQGLLSVL